MLNNHAKPPQPQALLLPPSMPSQGRELGELIRAVCKDSTFSPSERVQTLGEIWKRTSSEQPRLKGAIFISTIAHRVAKLSREDPDIQKAQYVLDLMKDVAQEALEQSSRFNPQDFANTAWAFATLGFRNEQLFSALAQEASKQSSRFKPQELSNTAWAFATLGIRNEQLFSALAQEASKQSAHFNPQDIANTAWAFAVDFPELVSGIIGRSILEQSALDDIHWLQCHQALLAAGTVSPSESFPRYQRIIERYQPESKNRFELSVEGALCKALEGTPFSLFHAYVIAGVATDFLAHITDRRIVIECDGDRFHRSTGPDGGQPLGCDRLQDRLCKVFGYEVVHIRDSEWNLHDHADLLRNKLAL